SGALTVATSEVLDFETTPTFSLEVEVSDGELTASATITVNLNDLVENSDPSIANQTFAIDENSENGTSVGTIAATDPDGDALSYTILNGNDAGGFALDNSSGLLTVAASEVLDFETTPTFNLEVEVSDGELTASATITVNLNDLVENSAPSIANQTFAIDENSANGTSVGTITATDPDGDALSYTILSGNGANGFELDGESGALTVATSEVLDFETTPAFSLEVEVSDGEFNASAIISINLNDLDEQEPLGLEDQKLVLYPNPVDDFLKVNLEKLGIVESVYLIDLQGKIIQRTMSTAGVIEMGDLSDGVYQLHIQTKDELLSRKIIVSNQ
ncbi:MAG: T9SS type A sorting domain-containing protein, partial [Ekhidna sp.]|nr:T9SS type A sorting domain-containing protein [Ekhidna sp.]